ncbi:TonB-dependent receptor plug domain-containing protein [Sphingomonas quercus]|uniref:TonB-dependent receptor plug domain-containing protein n=1 Tax=Sphingomonas quercus TaxID=2842451 RepID=A0ABS6BIU1_9SPHN|nr:TonB-dependent receptor plug domain-containing protein [Sphingomonas quercus]MBU3078223.1 TonB-dependent receptor plug domain-containing protein [Sphingomonas quercus]
MTKIRSESFEDRARKTLLASTALFATMGISTPGFAQDSADASVPQDEIVVTGSSIRGVAPVGSQMIGVTRDTIQNNAPANTKDLMATVPQLGNFGTNAEQSTSNRFRTAGFYPNIHNVGIYATLTLINGHRIAPTGGEAVFPDPSIVPTIALQRVEIVADGGSAIYGSDAVAGVVNFIYRKNVEGIEAQATYGFNDSRYLKANAAILGGHRWATGGVMLAYEFSKNKHPLNTEIELSARGGDQRGFGTELYPGRDQRGTNCQLPNLNIVSTRNVSNGVTDLRGTGYAYNADGTVTAGTNRCGIQEYEGEPVTSPVIGDSRRHAVLLTANQQLGERVNLWTEVNWSKYNTSSFGGTSNIAVRMVDSNPYFGLGLPAGMTPDDVISTDTEGRKYYMIRRSGLGLWAPRDPSSIQYAKMLAVTAGLDIDVGGEWQITPTVHISRTNDYNSDPELDP